MRIVLALMLAGGLSAMAAEAKKASKPKKVTLPSRHDPADMPFRFIPMSNAVRSIHIPLATNLHVAFDTELLRTHTVWEGETLNLWGTPFHQGKDRFYCDFNGKVLWTMPPVFPWAVGKLPDSPQLTKLPGARFVGIDTKDGLVTLLYELPSSDGRSVRVRETPVSSSRAGTLIREFQVQGNINRLWFLVCAVPEGKKIVFPDGAGPFLKRQTVDFDFEAGEWREAKNESEAINQPWRGRYELVWHENPFRNGGTVRLAIETQVEGDEVRVSMGRALPPEHGSGDAAKVFPSDKGFLLPAGDESYRLEHFPVPKEIELGVTGMDFLPNGDLAVCTWLGDVYIVQKPTGAPASATYRRFARGLCEPGGLKVIDGEVYIVQKQQLTRLKDTDGNGEADLFECINQDWGFTGNYHDFSFGPTLDRDGNFHVFRIGAHGQYDIPFMGWDIVVSRDGRAVTPFCSGLRSPDGFGTYQGDIFMTENQGNWQGACKLNHLQKGRFYGYPSAKPAPREQFDNPTKFEPPAIWFPYSKMSKSASGIAVIDDDRFGPFKGQMLVGEFQLANVMRVFLEKVNGEWQGCVWPFGKGFNSGVNRIAFGPDGKLYAGGLKNGAWAAVAPKDFSLDRVAFTGKVPFEVKEVRAKPDGFDLVFTQPVDPATAGKADNWDVGQYNYEYHQKYGSAEYDFDGKADSSSPVKVVSATVSADKLSVRLKLESWRAGYVAMIRALDVSNADGKLLRNDTFYYTLNQIPK